MTSLSSHSTALTSTALVLGGGGSAGNAWEIGVIAGLSDAGIDVTRADLVVGTSAGSTVAAQVTAAGPRILFSQILDAQLPVRPPAATDGTGRAVVDHLRRTNDIIAAASDAAGMRRGMGTAALELAVASGEDGRNAWRTTVASRLPSQDWPEQRVLITAVDARSGDGVVFDRDSGVDLVDAVAASCSSSSAYRIGDRSYIDGGYRRNENADLARGYERVLVLSPFSGRTRHPLAWGLQLDAQVEELRGSGSVVETICPDDASLAAFGENMMNPASRPPAARAGFAQGKRVADELRAFWVG